MSSGHAPGWSALRGSLRLGWLIRHAHPIFLVFVVFALVPRLRPSSRPAAKFSGTGGLSVAVWKHKTEQGSDRYSIRIDRTYKDEAGFKTTAYRNWNCRMFGLRPRSRQSSPIRAPHSWPACRVTIGTYPTSSPFGGVTRTAGSRSASLPTVGGGKYSRSLVQFLCNNSTRS